MSHADESQGGGRYLLIQGRERLRRRGYQRQEPFCGKKEVSQIFQDEQGKTVI
jgi:hypothetical protein